MTSVYTDAEEVAETEAPDMEREREKDRLRERAIGTAPSNNDAIAVEVIE